MTERRDGPGRFLMAAKELGLDVELKEFPASTRTAEDAAAACGCDVGQIVKSLVFQGKHSRKPVMLLVSGRNRVDQKGVSATIGEPLDRPDGQYVRDLTGFAIGGIPPVGHDVPLRTYMDEDLLQYDRIFAAAGSPNSVFPTEPRRLAEVAKAKVIRIKG
jgi:prolyl-tRNA editing enzyme YbaK/EbsC (Cys-tRNA(Pro) deacylase)